MKTEQDKLSDGYIIQSVDEFFDYSTDISMQMLERIIFRNILYYMGEQWIDWAVKQAVFQRVMPDPNEPTPVSNIIRDYVRSMKALILNKDFSITIWPNSNDQEDIDASIMGEHLLKHMDAANDEEFLDEKEKVAIWMVLAGTAFDRTYPEMERGDWYLDKKGNLLSTGDVVTECLSPFNVAVDPLGDSLKRKRAVGIKSIKPREWVEDTFHVKLSTDEGEATINYQKKLMKLVANVSPWKGAGLESLSEYEDDDIVVFKEIEYRPDKQYPNGRYVASCCGKKIFGYDKLPIPSEKGKWEYSITDYHYFYVPGRFWSDAGVNDLISPQNTINRIDQALESNRGDIGRPMVLLGSDVEVEKLSKYGKSLLVLKYDASLSNGMKPEIKHGTPLPTQVLEERSIQRAVAQDAAGDPKNVLRGQAPSASASGVMVDILRDAAEQGHYPDLVRFYRSLKRTYRKRLILARDLYTEERMVKVGGKGKQKKVMAFSGANLRDNTDVRLELSSGIASTKSGQTQLIMELIKGGFFAPDSGIEAEVRYELLKRMGLSGFKNKTNTDTERAMGENSIIANTDATGYTIETVVLGEQEVQIPVVPGVFLSIGNPETGEAEVLSDDPVFKYDDHNLHYEIHRSFIVSSEFSQMSTEAQEIMIAHTDIHKAMMDAQMMEAAQKQAAMQQTMEPQQGEGLA